MLKKRFVLIAAVAAIGGLLYLTNMDDKLSHQVINQSRNTDLEKANIELDRYRLVTPAQKVDGINKNLSGLTFCPSSNTLFAITNKPCRIYELNKNGKLLRTIALPGFQDTEGIVYVHDDLFAIIEERRHTLNLLQITANTTTVNRQQALNSITVDSKDTDNFGFEGLLTIRENQYFLLLMRKSSDRLLK